MKVPFALGHAATSFAEAAARITRVAQRARSVGALRHRARDNRRTVRTSLDNRFRAIASTTSAIVTLGMIGFTAPHVTNEPSRVPPAVVFPACGSNLASILKVPTERQVVLPWVNRPRLTVRVYCRPGPRWFVSETVGRLPSLVYQQPPPTVSAVSPIGVASLFTYSARAVPLALIETSLGASVQTFELFLNANGKLGPILLSGTDPPGLLTAGNSAYHGDGFSCTRGGRGDVVVTRTEWRVIGSRTAPTLRVVVSTERWTLGGSPMHEVSRRELPSRTTSYEQTAPLGVAHC